MKFFYLFLLSVFSIFIAKASTRDSLLVKPDSISNWKINNTINLFFTENSYTYWSAGGNNSLSGILKIHLKRDFKTKHITWKNELKSNYGLNKEEKRELRKTDDLFEINSAFGYREDKNSNWYYSAKFNFKTQFTNGYNYPDINTVISKWFSPAYTFLGIGSEYSSKKDNFKIYVSPITNKTTFVFNQALADEGSFGVAPATYDDQGNLISKGENTKVEFGTLVSGEWSTKIMEDIKMANKLILYSDYLNHYGNIDVNWELNLDLTVNKYVKANIGSHLLYDDDIKFKEDINNNGVLVNVGPKIQFKQLLGIGFSYTFH